MRDDFTEEVKRTLANRVANVCSRPDCHAVTSGPQMDSTKALNVGVAAHITSASQGGPRYNPILTAEERSNVDNGIWLCQTCAKLVDNDVQRHSETLLRAWKTMAEDRALRTIGKTAHTHETESERKRRAVTPWIGKTVTHSHMNTGRAVALLGPVASSSAMQVLECTEFIVKLSSPPGVGSYFCRSIPWDIVTIGHDDRADRLEIRERNA